MTHTMVKVWSRDLRRGVATYRAKPGFRLLVDINELNGQLLIRQYKPTELGTDELLAGVATFQAFEFDSEDKDD